MNELSEEAHEHPGKKKLKNHRAMLKCAAITGLVVHVFAWILKQKCNGCSDCRDQEEHRCAYSSHSTCILRTKVAASLLALRGAAGLPVREQNDPFICKLLVDFPDQMCYRE